MPLSDTACRAGKPAEKIRKLSDGKGLQRHVMLTGSKLGRVAYRFAENRDRRSGFRRPQ